MRLSLGLSLRQGFGITFIALFRIDALMPSLYPQEQIKIVLMEVYLQTCVLCYRQNLQE